MNERSKIDEKNGQNAYSKDVTFNKEGSQVRKLYLVMVKLKVIGIYFFCCSFSSGCGKENLILN